MDELHLMDKFEREVDHLAVAVSKIDPDDPDPHAVNIALGQAKLVRRQSNLVVRALARFRDNLHSQEANNKS
jgi:hypothetical protein